ncbi:MAG: metallophosphoesterase family protein [Actinomycetota bacterium]
MHRLASIAAVALFGAVATVTTLGMTSRTTGDVGPGTVEVSARWRTGGRTALLVPPLGNVSASTHAAPVGLRAQVNELDVERVESLVTRDRPDAVLRAEAVNDITPLIRRLALRSLAAAVVVGGLAGAIVPRRRRATVLAGAAGGTAAIAVLLAATWASYDVEAFEEARFDGALERAPQIARTVSEHVESFEDVRSRVEALGQQITSLYAVSTTERVAASSGETVVLHVTDLHSNPVGLEIAAQLAAQFRVDAVIDTGDVTSFGSPLEAQVASLMRRVPAPYYLVPGNHDSPTNRSAFKQIDGVRVLNGTVARVGDVRILGVGDPTFTANNDLSEEEIDAALTRQRSRIEVLVDRYKPDLLAVHNPAQGDAAIGEVALVVAGHVHRRTFDDHDGTVVLTGGSTGATGVGSFTTEAVERYEAQLLRFVGERLVAVDGIEMEGVEGEFRIERRLVDPPDDDLDDQTSSMISPAAVHGSMSRFRTRS